MVINVQQLREPVDRRADLTPVDPLPPEEPVHLDRAHVPTSAIGARDAHLVARAKAGDRTAMAELHRHYARMIHAILLARVPVQHADDLAQDVFVHAISKLAGLRTPAAFAGWIAMIARNRATDFHRRRRPTQELDESRVDGAGVSAHKRMRALEVMTAIQRVPATYREALIMRLVEGMSGPEIAAVTGLTNGSVRVNLHRGMKLLREALGLDSEEEESR
jgi:RNA polymerase sigma-70 factor (ECF subfamily)